MHTRVILALVVVAVTLAVGVTALAQDVPPPKDAAEPAAEPQQAPAWLDVTWALQDRGTRARLVVTIKSLAEEAHEFTYVLGQGPVEVEIVDQATGKAPERATPEAEGNGFVEVVGSPWPSGSEGESEVVLKELALVAGKKYKAVGHLQIDGKAVVTPPYVFELPSTGNDVAARPTGLILLAVLAAVAGLALYLRFGHAKPAATPAAPPK